MYPSYAHIAPNVTNVPDPHDVGASGVLGHRVAMRFLRDGYADIRLGSHRPDALDDMKLMGAGVVDFSWDREETYGVALKGVKSVLCIVAYNKGRCCHLRK